MDRLILTYNIDAQVCIDAGYPHPDIDPDAFLDVVRDNVAMQIQHHGMDLEYATETIKAAPERAMNPRPIRRPLSAIESGILDDLAA